jgi:glucose-6-phosphate isomerase
MRRHLGRQSMNLGSLEERVAARLESWREAGTGRRIWNRDGTVWVTDPQRAAATLELTNRLDWLEMPVKMRSEIDELEAFADDVRRDGFRHAVLLGMGGSSLAPEVLQAVYGNLEGCPALLVCDSTDPGAVKRIAVQVDPAQTLFIVSSKSGGTLETLSFFKFFFDRVRALKADPGGNFVAITDPGSKLEALAGENRFRHVFSSPPGVGGRYSALTHFGMVPAALIGVDLAVLLDRASVMAEACGPDIPEDQNPGLALGAALGELALAGRDKLTLLASPEIAHFGVWVEQLVAESTGKNGAGILPVAGEKPGGPEDYGADRVFAHIRLAGGDNAEIDACAAAVEAAGHPLIRIDLDDRLGLGAEFFRWELATAAAGAGLGINPFDQPNVEASKVKARELMEAFDRDGSLPAEKPELQAGSWDLYGGRGARGEDTAAFLGSFLEQAAAGDYVALMAYVPQTAETDSALGELRLALRRRTGLAVTEGYGPRFLHSTGQLHKGDGNTGVFIQITHQPAEDLQIPAESYTFGVLLAAQAQGDYRALAERGRRIVRVHVKDAGEGVPRALREIAAMI